MIKIKFSEWVKSFFGVGETSIPMTQNAISNLNKLDIELFAITAAINLIASSVSKCEFKTYLTGTEIKADEYYLWNVEPNKNQNSSQFLNELISKLIYEEECLVIEISGQLIIADSFNQKEYATIENYFTDVRRGTMDFQKSFKMSEVLYFKLSDSNVRNLLSNLISGYNDLLGMATDKYNRSGDKKGILDIDTIASGNKDFKTKFEDLMNNRFKKFFAPGNAVLPLEKGYTYKDQGGEGGKKSTSEISDIAIITKEIFERVGQGLKIPPALLKGDIADIEKVTDNYLTFCIDPIIDMMGEEINRKRYRKVAFLAGSRLRIDSTCIRHIDLFSISEAFDKLIASGGYSIDELRIKSGDVPLNTVWSKKHWITKNYQDIEIEDGNLKGGEK